MSTWTPSDTVELRRYHQKTGGKLRAALAAGIVPLQGTTIEQVALEAKFKEGIEATLHLFDLLLSEPANIDDASAGRITNM